MSIIKGQNLRVKIGTKAIAYSTNCTVHMASNLEDSSTKDSTGSWTENEITSKSWDVSVDALYSLTTDATGMNSDDIIAAWLAGTAVTVTFENCDGTLNREKESGTYYLSGSALIADVNVSAQNRANGTLTVQLTGNGELSRTVSN